MRLFEGATRFGCDGVLFGRFPGFTRFSGAVALRFPAAGAFPWTAPASLAATTPLPLKSAGLGVAAIGGRP